MTKLGIFSWFSYPLHIKERFKMIKSAGFEATSLWWGDENKNLQPEMARKSGLQIDNIHAPFDHPNDLWLDNLNGENYLNMLISCVEDCMHHNIRVAVIHITGFSEPTDITYLGLERVKKLVDFAENKGVYLAFENLNYLQHLNYIFENIQSEHLGFCYDSGHENCYHRDVDCLSLYGNKLLALHIDDNFGDYDTHLLPYDGTVNWNRVKERLKESKSIDYITLEVDFNPKHEKSQIYKELSAEEFLTLAYEKAVKLI